MLVASKFAARVPLYACFDAACPPYRVCLGNDFLSRLHYSECFCILALAYSLSVLSYFTHLLVLSTELGLHSADDFVGDALRVEIAAFLVSTSTCVSGKVIE